MKDNFHQLHSRVKKNLHHKKIFPTIAFKGEKEFLRTLCSCFALSGTWIGWISWIMADNWFIIQPMERVLSNKKIWWIFEMMTDAMKTMNQTDIMTDHIKGNGKKCWFGMMIGSPSKNIHRYDTYVVSKDNENRI